MTNQRFSIIYPDIPQFLNPPKVCKMTFELAGGTKDYLQLEVDAYDNFTGVDYLGDKLLLEYTVGEMLLKVGTTWPSGLCS